MSKRNIQEDIGKLSRLRELPVTDTTLAALRKGLSDRVNLISARAAQIAADLRLKPLIPELLAAFDRLFRNPVATDPQCWGKNAIAKALTDLDYDESAPFLLGYRYVQMEPVWGGKADTAITLRSLCTLAVLQCVDLPRAEKFRHLLQAMADREEAVRVDALRALEQMEGEEAALLLRLKAVCGDQRAAVVGQAIESLLRLEGPRGLEFARAFLAEREWENPGELRSTAEEIAEEAALAMGASRLPEAVETLKEAWTAHPKVVFLQAISTSRQETGFQFLLSLINEGRERDAAAALEALALHRDSPEVRTGVQAALAARGSAALSEKFAATFDVR